MGRGRLDHSHTQHMVRAGEFDVISIYHVDEGRYMYPPPQVLTAWAIPFLPVNRVVAVSLFRAELAERVCDAGSTIYVHPKSAPHH